MKLPINTDKKKIVFILVILYSILLMWGFVTYLEPTWGYFGIEKDDITIEIQLLTLLFCLLPIFFIPIKIYRPSIFAIWLLYIFTYIPMVVGTFFDKKILLENKWIIALAYATSMLFLCTFYKIKTLKIHSQNLPSKYFWTIFYTITFLMLGYIVYLFKDNLTFANILSSEDVYNIRFSGQKIEAQSPIAGYFIMWLSNALFPFIFSVGLVEKNKKKVIIAIIGIVIMYMTMANKQYLFSIIFIYIIYKLLNSKPPRFLTKFILFITTLVAVLLIIFNFFNLPQLNNFLFPLTSLILVRTIYTSTFMTIYYNVFFETHPYIYFSHITGINMLIDYPYNRSLGIEVGTYFYPIADNFNANANFFITDGLSSLGLIGVPIIAFIVSFIFFIYDSSVTKSNFILAILLIANSTISLMNASIFTTLISGGLLLFIFLLNNNNLFSKKVKN